MKKNAQCHTTLIHGIYVPFYYEMFHFSACYRTHARTRCAIVSWSAWYRTSYSMHRSHFVRIFYFSECFFSVALKSVLRCSRKHMKQSIWYARCCCTWSNDRWWKPKHHHITSNLFVSVACEHNLSALFGIDRCCRKQAKWKKYKEINKENVYATLVMDSLLCATVLTLACDLGLICTLAHKRCGGWLASACILRTLYQSRCGLCVCE